MTQTTTQKATRAATQATAPSATDKNAGIARDTVKVATPAPKGEAMTEHQNGSSASTQASSSHTADRRSGRGGRGQMGGGRRGGS